MRRLALPLLLLTLFAPLAAARVRTVRHPANACSYSLAPVWGGGPIGATGLTNAQILVFGQTAQCSQWAAYSSVDWMTVQAAPMAAQPAALLTVTANTSTAPRSGTLIIAGVRLVITQEGAAAIAPRIEGNILLNGTFDRDLASWGWFTRYPNGNGTAAWSQLDANGSPVSGSILLRDEDFVVQVPGGQQNYAFQRLQCVPIEGGFYQYGAKVRTGSSGGAVEIAFITYTTPDCSHPGGQREYKDYYVTEITPSQPGAWQKFDFVQGVSGTARSAIIVLVSASEPDVPFETWFDDVYLRKQ